MSLKMFNYRLNGSSGDWRLLRYHRSSWRDWSNHLRTLCLSGLIRQDGRGGCSLNIQITNGSAGSYYFDGLNKIRWITRNGVQLSQACIWENKIFRWKPAHLRDLAVVWRLLPPDPPADRMMTCCPLIVVKAALPFTRFCRTFTVFRLALLISIGLILFTICPPSETDTN